MAHHYEEKLMGCIDRNGKVRDEQITNNVFQEMEANATQEIAKMYDDADAWKRLYNLYPFQSQNILARMRFNAWRRAMRTIGIDVSATYLAD